MSIKEYEEYSESNEAEEQRKANEGATRQYNPANPPAPPHQGGADLSGKELLSKVENMSDEEYAKNREKILREVKEIKYEDGAAQ